MESKRLAIYILFCLAFIAFGISSFFDLIFVTYFYLILIALLLIGMVYYYNSLTYLIQLYHPERYDEIKYSMKYFFLIETIPLCLTVILNCLSSTVSNEDALVFIVNTYQVIWILYPLL
jgi:hypothetical protein